MELDQIVKRLEWLDDEHRKDKSAITSLEKRIGELEGGIPAVAQQIKDVSIELSRVTATLSRIDQVESSIVQIRVDYTRNLEAVEKLRAEHERESEKLHRADLEALNRTIGEVRKGLDPIPDLKRGIQLRQEEDFRLSRLIEETQQKIVENRRNDDEYKRSLRVIEEAQRTENKRLTDLLGEVTSLRKRIEEQRGKVDVTTDQLRKLETRLGEISLAENDRKAAQAAFLEKQALVQAERERTWREWLARFEVVEKRASGIDTQLQALETIQRSVKRSQDGLDDVTQRIERRINEITEMQRLAEERFRQDWSAYKAEDQKRWANYSIAHEEQQRETGRQFDKVTERFVGLEDAAQELQEAVVQLNEDAVRRLQGLLNLVHDWAETNEKMYTRSGS